MPYVLAFFVVVLRRVLVPCCALTPDRWLLQHGQGLVFSSQTVLVDTTVGRRRLSTTSRYPRLPLRSSSDPSALSISTALRCHGPSTRSGTAMASRAVSTAFPGTVPGCPSMRRPALLPPLHFSSSARATVSDQQRCLVGGTPPLLSGISSNTNFTAISGRTAAGTALLPSTHCALNEWNDPAAVRCGAGRGGEDRADTARGATGDY